MATFIPNITDIFPEPQFFAPDFGFIDKMLKRKESMYLEGFSKLNNEYNIINRKLTHADNISARDKFLNQAKENLKNLSAMDLSDMANVKAAGEVFKPFYGNKLILGDQSFTSFVDGQEALANSFRLKDGGKNFSQNNLRYVQMQREQFAKDTPESVFDYMSDKKSFTPYHNWHADMAEAMKNFKPSYKKYDKLNGLYKVTIENESWTNEEISKYLNTVLSDQAKQQMKIDAYVAYGNNPEALKQAYIEKKTATIPVISSLIDDIDKQIKVEKDPAKKAELQQTKDYFANKKTETSNIIRNLQSADPKFIKRNAETLAFDLYYDEMIEKSANGYAHEHVSQTIDADDVALAIWQNSEAWRREEYKQDREDARKYLELSALKPGSTPMSIMGPAEDMNSYEDIYSSLNTTEAAYKQAYGDVVNLAASYYKVDAKNLTKEQWAAFIKNNRATGKVREMYEAASNYEAAQQNIKDYENGREDYAKTKIGLKAYNNLSRYTKAYEYYDKLMAGGKAVTIGNRTYADPKFAAAASIGYDYSIIQKGISDLNAFRNEYSRDEMTKVTKSRPGYVLPIDDDEVKTVINTIGGNLIDKDRMLGGIQFFPSLPKPGQIGTGSFDVAIPLKKGKTKEETKAIADDIIETLKANKTDVTWSYSEATNSIYAKGLGAQLSPSFNPFRNIPTTDQLKLGYIDNQVLAPGQFGAAKDFLKYDRTGNMIPFSIRKYMGNNGKPEYFVYMQNKLISGFSATTLPDTYKAVMDMYMTKDVQKIIDATKF